MGRFKAKKPTRYVLGIVVAIVLVLGFAGIRQLSVNIFRAKPHVSEAVRPSPPTVNELLRLTNEERVKAGAKPLILDPLLDKSAQIKADDMSANDYFGHVNAKGKHGYTLIRDVGKECSWVSENIWLVGDEFSAEKAVTSWVGSAPHFKAMTNQRYESTGFGIAGNKYIVQHFCDER